MKSDPEVSRAALDLIERAFELPPAERIALLEAEGNSEVRAEARRLLDADAQADDFLSGPAPELRAALSELSDLDPAASAGEHVGTFRLISLLGRGGMGEVWLAEREGSDFQQQVAIKLLPPSSGPAATARFRRERRILGRLTHPHVARLLDGGVTPAGRPWLAMELVTGKNLAEHCRAEGLSVEARLRLFAEVCDAVQFAHQNLVVHRDLKPGNVLVGPSGEPKLLDFGIAKLLEHGSEDGVQTRVEERPMTLEYAAPEQIRGGPITPATDVWALGVMLHELLTGVRPFQWPDRAQMEYAILTAAPARPSAGIDPASLLPGESVAERKSALRGDLDAIVLKALRSGSGDRYPSAGSLAADIRRHLELAPVTARGDATGYLLRTMARRHRAAFLLAAAAVLALVLGLAATLWQARRAREEARRAERTQDFLVAMLRNFDPRDSAARPADQKEILARGEARLDELGSDPAVQARLLRAFAQTWYDLEDYGHAAASARRALTLERAVAPRSPEVASTLVLLGDVLFEQGDYAAAERPFEEALALAREREGSRGETVALTLNELAGVKRRQSRLAEAERLRRQALEIQRTTLGERSDATLATTNDLGVLLGDEGRFEESADLLRRTCPLMEEVHGRTHLDTLACWGNLARDLVELGRAAEAESLADRVLAEQAALFADDLGDQAYTEATRARALDALGRSAEAVPLFEDAIGKAGKTYGPGHGTVASFLGYQSTALRRAGRPDDAVRAARRAVEIARAALGEEHATTARSHYALGCALAGLGHAEEARPELERALVTQERLLGADHPDTRRTRAALDQHC